MLKIILSFNFFRLSELQELLFTYYFVWHSIFLRVKVSKDKQEKTKDCLFGNETHYN